LERYLFALQRFFPEKFMIARFGFGAGLIAALFFCLPLGSSVAVHAAAQTATPAATQQTIAEKIAASKDLLDINVATAAQLKALPGMGDAYAQRVIAGRPYSAKNQLTTRGILPADEYEKIKVLIIAHRAKK
jgi:DNA uptake protein ComE-like DNA-binding protein